MSNPRSIPAGSRSGWIPDPRDLSETPGGTLYAMTPGGTKITYNREMLLMIQQSPLSKSPLNLTAFPGLSKTSHAAPVATEPEVDMDPLFFRQFNVCALQTPAVTTTASGDSDMFPMEDH